MSYPSECPNCGADLRGERIPQEYIDKGYYSPEDPYYYRVIAEYSIELDRSTNWICPDCNHKWGFR